MLNKSLKTHTAASIASLCADVVVARFQLNIEFFFFSGALTLCVWEARTLGNWYIDCARDIEREREKL